MINTKLVKIFLLALLILAFICGPICSLSIGLFCWAFHTFLRYYALLPKKSVHGDHVFITGAGQGIGAELALQFAELGAKVTLAELNVKLAEKTKQEIQKVVKTAQLQVFQCDVSDQTNVNEVFKKSIQNFGDVDILINNAGIGNSDIFHECDDVNYLTKTIHVNLLSNFYTVDNVLKRMVERNKGHIVTIASMSSYLPSAMMTGYTSSKAGVVHFHEALNLEMQILEKNVYSTCICPWFIKTAIAQDVKESSPYFLPHMEVKESVQRMVNAIRQNEYIVVMPFRANLLIYIKWLMPYWVTITMMAGTMKDSILATLEKRRQREEKLK